MLFDSYIAAELIEISLTRIKLFHFVSYNLPDKYISLFQVADCKAVHVMLREADFDAQYNNRILYEYL